MSTTSLSRSIKALFDDNIDDHHNDVKHKINYKHYAIMTILFTILLVSMVWLLAHDSHKCTVDRNTVNNCLKRMTFFSSEIERFPDNYKKLDKYCKEKMESVKCIRRFVEGCLEPNKLQKSYFKKFVLNYQRQLDKICLRQSERKRFLEYSDCLSEKNFIQNVSNCQESLQNQLIYISQNLNVKHRLQTACCAFATRTDCFDRTIIQQSTCTNDNQIRNFIYDLIEGPFAGIIDTVCGPHHLTYLSCQQLIEPKLYEKLFKYPEKLLLKKINMDEIFASNESSLIDNNNNTDQIIDNNLTITNNSTIMNKLKVVQLIFYENFLSYFLILN